jgi:serine/threonine protein kinase
MRRKGSDGFGARMAINSGQMIGQYRVLEFLGQGGMASVYKAHHPKLDRVVAIKMIHPQYVTDANFIGRFEREAQIVAKLEHPNIVPVYDASEQDGMPYIVMKYIEGKTLKDVLNDGALEDADTLHVITQIAAALDYAHGRGVLHRDVKPSNIMVDHDAIPYLTDFGLARLAIGGATTLSADMLIGTPFYMSPEQARGDDHIDARSDVYSLGVLLYELLTGAVPYSGGTPYAIIQQHISAALPAPRLVNPKITMPVESIITKALAKERDARYQSAGELAAALSSALIPNASPAAKVVVTVPPIAASTKAPQSVSIPSETAKAVKTPPAHKRSMSWVWIVGGAALLVLIALLALGAIRRVTTRAADATATIAISAAAFDVPVLTLADAQAALDANPTDAAAYLALFRAQLAAGQTDGAEQLLRDGEAYAEDRVAYYLTAAAEAFELDQTGAAFVIYRDGLGELADDANFARFRAIAGEQLYRASLQPGSLALFEVRGTLRPDSDESPIFTAMRARSLLTADRARLADGAINASLQRAARLPEALLVQGELGAADGNNDSARRLWEGLLASDNVPEWVRVRARELMGS